jgi:peptidoglycan/LPS O-acetylase OafA/YrhL
MGERSQAGVTSGPRHYEFLDALRGIAVLGVVAVHTVQNFHFPTLESAIGLGDNGVPLFYMVSAFSLCLSLDQRTRAERRPLLNYAIRRFFRIAPMFYLAVLIYLLKPYVLPAGVAPVILDPIAWSKKAWHVVLTVLFLNGWSYQAINLIVPGGWSVAVETNFYLLLPLLFRFATSLRRALALFGVSLLAATAMRKALYLLMASRIPASSQTWFGVFSTMWLPTQLPVFALGIVMFRAVDPREIGGRTVSPRRVAALLAALVVSILVARLAPHGIRRWTSREVQIAFVLLFGAMLLAYRPTRLLVNPFTRYIGKVSYSVYLTHFVGLHLFMWASHVWYEPWKGARPSFLLAYPCVLGIATIISTITFRMVEVPGQSLGRRLIARLESRPQPAPTEEPEPTLAPSRPGLM